MKLSALPKLPNATLPDGVGDTWLTEPAKAVAGYISKAVALLSLVVAALTSVTDLIPESQRHWIAGAVVAGGAILVGLQRLQAVLTRDRVYSPATVRAITAGEPRQGDEGAIADTIGPLPDPTPVEDPAAPPAPAQ